MEKKERTYEAPWFLPSRIPPLRKFDLNLAGSFQTHPVCIAPDTATALRTIVLSSFKTMCYIAMLSNHVSPMIITNRKKQGLQT